ncbi:ricin-type beta-trefoil lectin domain protein [Streptomonospora sp. PA3]|uniref:RICIN domain-containing protein n=1 Tax=Streptomonospora sp. PA3 TaxID=2607326 RepID=UPI0012DCEC73|nr:RICIN domain-containing protein [Streptomonospora sp. PA3]MUL42047.1 ricin-type beta-trefoil lectin domain protein [Streptomonospora sp. PA3]
MTGKPRPNPHRPRPHTALAASLLSGCLLAAGAAAPAQADTADTAAGAVTITPDPSYQGQEFQGWGTSLAWFANATGGYPDEIRTELARMVFGDQGLNLNIARYNAGGGNAPDVPDYLRAGGAVEGWWQAPEGTTREDTDWWSADDPADWNPDADATQRWWVDRIKDDVTHWEVFSNSPPYFMTESGYVSGGFDPDQNQLKPESVDDFAAYMVGVSERLEQAHGIEVDTVEPFNEPNTDYWGTTLGPDGNPTGGRQEGAHMGPQLQQDVIRALAAELSDAETEAVIAAMDETNPGRFAQNWQSYPEDVRELVAQLNVHTYGTDGRTTVRDLAKAAKKPLWMSETGGDWGDGKRWGGGGQDFETMSTGLGLANLMVDDLRELEPSAWVFWQPVEDYDNMAPGGESDVGGNWGSIQIPFSCTAEDTLETCPIRTNTKYHTARNFTHYIRPGDHFVATDDGSSVAAVSGAGDAATVVHVNDSDRPRTVTVDLSKFGHIAGDAAMTPVVTDAGGGLVRQDPVEIEDGSAAYTVPAESVTTFVVEGVSGVAEDAALVQPGHDYRLTGVQSGKALTATDDGTAAVIRGTEPGDEAQLWDIAKVTEGTDNRQRYVLTNEATGRRLAVRGDSLVLKPAHGRAGAVAQWTMSTTGDGSWTFVNRATGELIDVAGQATEDGSEVSVWQPTSGPNQRWEITDTDA